MRKSVCLHCRQNHASVKERQRDDHDEDSFTDMWEKGVVSCPETFGGKRWLTFAQDLSTLNLDCEEPPKWCGYTLEHLVMEDAAAMSESVCRGCQEEQGCQWGAKEEECWKHGLFFCLTLCRLIEVVAGTPLDCPRQNEHAALKEQSRD